MEPVYGDCRCKSPMEPPRIDTVTLRSTDHLSAIIDAHEALKLAYGQLVDLTSGPFAWSALMTMAEF